MSLDRPAPHALRSGTPTVRAALEGMQTSPCESFDPPPHQPISVHPLAHLSAPHPHATNKHAHTCRTHARTRTLSLTHTHTHTHTRTHAHLRTRTHTHTHARLRTRLTASRPASHTHATAYQRHDPCALTLEPSQSRRSRSQSRTSRSQSRRYLGVCPLLVGLHASAVAARR